MAKAAKKKAAPKKPAAKYEEKVKTVLSFDELIAISLWAGKSLKTKMIKRKSPNFSY
jgi:hypothetical protein